MSPTPQQVNWSWGRYRQRLHNLKTVALVLGVCNRVNMEQCDSKASVLHEDSAPQWKAFCFHLHHLPASAVYP